MASGIWTSVSGATAQAQNVDIVANNLANAETLAFKKDQPTFKEYLSIRERDQEPEEISRGPIKDKDFYRLDSRDQAFVINDATYTNFKQGGMKVTQAPLDVALDGPGFFEVSTPQGIRYTRQGSFKMAMDGRLVTSDGFPVLSQSVGAASASPAQPAVQPGQGGLVTQGGVAAGQSAGNTGAVAQRFINLRDAGGRVSIAESGEIYAGDALVAKLAVTEFQNLDKVRKTGGAYFESKDPANSRPQARKTVIRQGVLETSNVNPVEEMATLIRANRLFEQDLKAMKTYGELMGREANDVGKL